LRRLEQELHTNYTLIDISIQLGEKTPSCERRVISNLAKKRQVVREEVVYPIDLCMIWRRFATPGGDLRRLAEVWRRLAEVWRRLAEVWRRLAEVWRRLAEEW